LESPGKRLRPTLVILSTKVSSSQKQRRRPQGLIKIASAIELIHIASLIHDDVIDHAFLRHHKPTINAKWGEDTSIALGDYLYSVAFELIAQCKNSDILSCISSATKAMCEGELIQVCERDNLSLLKQRYILIVKKKTASLFAASCQAGAMLTNQHDAVHRVLRSYGLNFGIAFQIIDDCLDLIGEEKNLGKSPGADFKMGELTLPLLNLLSQEKDKNRLLHLLRQADRQEAFKEIKHRFINSSALLKTKADTSIYIQKAKKHLSGLKDSCFKESLSALADFIIERF
jgi:octaprenyl-diphosphate synthase